MHDPSVFNGSDKMAEIVKDNCFNVFVYGHTHTAKIKWEEKNLFINPGSPTDPASIINQPSVGLLKIYKGNHNAADSNHLTHKGSPIKNCIQNDSKKTAKQAKLSSSNA